MIKKQRMVRLNDINKSSLNGGHYKVYGFTIKDLSVLYGVSEKYIRNLISNKIIKPLELTSIIEHYNKRNKPKNGD